MFGFAPEQPDDTVRPFAADRFVDPLAREAFFTQLRRDGAVSDYLLRLRRADNSSIWVEVTATQHLDDSKVGSRIEALVRDVSERRKLEDQGRDLSHQLSQAEKMAALGQTVSGVAHELNNPLATILTWAERLAARPVDADTKRGLETILSESERAAKIVRNLLTFARKRNTTRALVDLNGIVREILTLRAYEQRVSNVTTLEALASGLPHVFADPHQVKQVLLNLIINAEQAMLTTNGRGTLVVRTWVRRRERDGAARDQRRWSGSARGGPVEDLRPVLHHQGSGKGDRAGADGRLCDRAGARGTDSRSLTTGVRCVVLCLVPGGRRCAAPFNCAGTGPGAADRPRLRRACHRG